ncbi:MAG TPA: mechanosensitive ion channel family protein [Kofleriaceae bacterium]|nr:mechanosensitive ion channel family protein [Kofleriaceae bacterium]
MNEAWQRLRDYADLHLLPLAGKVGLALVMFVAGRWIARVLVRGVGAMMERGDMDVSLRKFLGDVLYAILLVAVVTVTLDTVGIHTTAVVAVIGAAGLAVGLALQGSLSNFAAGVMLIVLRHYRVGDLVVIGKYTGRVEAIKVFHTVLVTSDNREVLIPNGQVITAPIENLTVLGRRRIDLRVEVAPTADLHKVAELIEGAIMADDRVHAEPRPSLELAEIARDKLVLHLRPWTDASDQGAAGTAMLLRARDALQAAGVEHAISIVGA